MAPIQELAQDERSPALGEDLRATRHRAELGVIRHPPSERLASPARKFIFLGCPTTQARSIVRAGRKAPGRYGMKTRFVLALLIVVAAVAAYGGTVLATSQRGITSTVFAISQPGEINAKTLSSSWQARIKQKGESDAWMLEN